LLFDYAFGALGLHRIEARIPSPHVRSRRAFEKLGAVCEGTLRESFSKHGQYLDTSLYVVFSSDWKTRNARDETAVTTGFQQPPQQA
jgi:RimJ/RimL family protein N-acetyltransferase